MSINGKPNEINDLAFSGELPVRGG